MTAPWEPLLDLAGTTLADKYRLVSLLGSGGMGVVYQAEQIGLGRSVAVKLLRRDLIATRFEWFRAEAMAASRINHPHAVAVYDFGVTADSIPYLVMEHLRGGTLSSLIEAQSLSVARIVAIGSQVLSALAEAHACGVVHCDLTADNVIVERLREGGDFAKVIDFGLARLFDLASRDSRLVGTAEYMAPEQIRGDLIQPATDLYAVGILLYEMVVGRTPFAASSVAVTLEGHLNAHTTPPHHIVPACPPALGELIMAALEKVPERRPTSAGDMRARLLAAGGGERDREPRSSTGPAARPPAPVGTSIPKPLGSQVPRPLGSPLPRGTGDAAAAAADVTGDAAAMAAEGTGDVARAGAAATAGVTRDALGRAPTQTSGGGNRPGAAGMPHRPPPARRCDRLTTDLTADLTAQLGGRGLPPAFVGRTAELDQLMSLAARGLPGPGAVALVGPAGIGKARLALELGRRLGPSGAFHATAADPSGLRTAWHPLLRLLESVLGLDPPYDLPDLRKAVARAGLPERDLPGLAELFGVAGPAGTLELAVRRREAHASVVRVLAAARRRTPNLIYCFVDLDEYDQPSRDAVRALALEPAVGGAPLVLVTAREAPEFAALVMPVDGLAPDAARTMAASLSGGARNVPDAGTIMALTGGSPSAVEQLAGWMAYGDSPSDMPSLLVDLVSVRVNRLDVAARRVLQAVAVHGSVAPRWAVEASLSKAELSAIQAPIWTGLLATDSGNLTIPSELVANVVVACTSADVRRRLHRRALEVMAGIAPASVLADHAEKAGETKLAHRYYMMAGGDAVRRFDDLGAAHWYSRAAAMARELESRGVPDAPGEVVDASLELAEVLRLSAQARLALGALDEVAGYPMSDRQRAAGERTRGLIALDDNDTAGAVKHLEASLGAALRAGDRDLLCQIYLDLARALDQAGRPDDAARELGEAVDVITGGAGLSGTSGPERLWRVALALAERLAGAGQLARARDVASQALGFARRGGWPHARGRLSALLADVYQREGDLRAAGRYRGDAIEEMRVLGDRRSTAELLLATVEAAMSRDADAAVAEWAPDPSETIRMAERLASEIGWREGVELSQAVAASRRGKR